MMVEEHDIETEILVSDAGVIVETEDTTSNLIVSDASVGVEEIDATSFLRMTNAAVMVELRDNAGDYCGPGDIGLVTYWKFSRGLHCYFDRADEAGLSITGELTLGAWVWFDTESRGHPVAIIGKWYEPTDNRSYVLYKNEIGEIIFAVSELGNSSITEVSDGGENFSVGEWKYIIGRFTPSKEIALFINGKWYSNDIDIPASIYDSSEAFEIGRYNRDNYFEGRLCHVFVSAQSEVSADIEAMYAHTKAMFQGITEGSPIVPLGIVERVSNAALMIEYQAATLLRVTNAGLMIEYAASKDIRLTNMAIEIERHETTPAIRLTNHAIMVERHDTEADLRLTNFAIMIERHDTAVNERMTNFAIMVERSSSSSSTSSSSTSSSSSTTSSSSTIP